MPTTEFTTAEPRVPAGLLAAGVPVPLEGVSVEARGTQGAVSHSVSIDPVTAMSGTTLATLAARTLIRELEEGSGWIESQGSRWSGARCRWRARWPCDGFPSRSPVDGAGSRTLRCPCP